MIDIHCHILPAFDDGPAVMNESVRMAVLAAADGITHLVATPHYSCGEASRGGDAVRAAEAFGEEVRRQGIGLTVLPGADVRLTFELIAAIGKKEVPTVNGSRYILLELPDLLPPNMEVVLSAARAGGYVPVITHPERNHSLLKAPGRVRYFRDAGCLFQITAMSITGQFGPEIQTFALRLVREGFCDFIASDAHDSSYRTPVLSRSLREVQRSFGDERAARLFVENPRAVIEDRELPA